ncbi:hypothetical protein PINS_up016006 [Pythium insidiosum]|nr:hypothetical protein PINS_up016006 [Pythium insidiosum]
MGCQQSHAVDTSSPLEKAFTEEKIRANMKTVDEENAGSSSNQLKEIYFRQYLSTQALAHSRIR